MTDGSRPIDIDYIVGDIVEKVGGDYRFVGPVVARFRKLSRVIRYVVEDDRGILHIFSARHLRPYKGGTTPGPNSSDSA